MKRVTVKMIQDFKEYLQNEEKAPATYEKYIRDIKAFASWCNNREISKEVILEYKQSLIEEYAPASVNSVLSSLNSFFEFNHWHEFKAKLVKVQRQIFAQREKELTKREYERLLIAAKDKDNKRLYYLMQTICATGIRVSELKFITIEAVKCGVAMINCKGKMRQVFLPSQLCKALKKYAQGCKVKSGSVFVTRSGKPLDRSNIWADMKKLCQSAGVSCDKVFPHNLRHLFARTYYSIQKDVVRLADILGHSSISTTRIYTMESGEVHRRQIQKLGLLRC